jgi:exopolyphosphatase/guanosine-5'-triphosphate,3'-diphosphate pyrophosphatase
MPKIAAIDVGSNAIRLVIGNLDERGKVEPVETLRMPVRLGKDVFSDQTLQESTIQSTVDTFIQFRRVIDDFGVLCIKAVATSAVREAQNKELLIERIESASGIHLEAISGEEESRLACLAVASAMDVAGKRILMVDIGGGSVEITITIGDDILSTTSLQLGTVRLLQNLSEEKAFLKPVSFSLLLKESVEAARFHIEHAISLQKLDFCVGTGGNVEEIGLLCQQLKYSPSERKISSPALSKLVAKLSKMSDHERMHEFNMRPDRADVILPASFVLNQIVSIAGVDDIYIPAVGLKNGLLIDMAEDCVRQSHRISDHVVLESALRIGNKYEFDEKHGLFVAKMALELFDQTMSLHRLGAEERLILEIGAILHDIGHFINTVDHDAHGAYILETNHLIGLSESQQKMVASLVRYHRKGYPYREYRDGSDLTSKERIVISKLCALLRLADALDSSHQKKIESLTMAQVNNRWVLTLKSLEDLSLEKWNLTKRRALFQDVFGTSLEVAE